jgi:uncharacterized protein YqgC (DUF456 family)
MNLQFAFYLLQPGDPAYDFGRVIGYILGVFCCLGSIIVPIIAVIWALKRKKGSSAPPQ